MRHHLETCDHGELYDKSIDAAENERSECAMGPITNRLGRFWLIGCLLLAAFFGIRALSASRTDSHATQAPPVAAAPTTPTLKNIEDIRVGERVRAENPTGELDLTFGEDVDPETWRHLELRLQKPDGSVSEINLLRPAAYVEALCAEIGSTIPVDIGHTDIRGQAEVLYVGPCPSIKRGEGRVVTGTFKHIVSGVVDVQLVGRRTPIGATANHPVWSVDRQQFIPAGELRPEERLLGASGVLRVAAVSPRTETTIVYNIEVQVDHVYHISSDGILVHNSQKCTGLLDEALEGTDGAHHLDDLIDAIDEDWLAHEAAQLAPTNVVQNHHLISEEMLKALDDIGFEGGRALRNRLDLQYLSSPGGHYGYEKWHMKMDEDMSRFIRQRGRGLTEEELLEYIHNYYQDPDISKRIPDVDLGF